MLKELSVLIVEDFLLDAELLIAELRRAGYEPLARIVDNRDAFIQALDDPPEIVLCDYNLPTLTAPQALEILGTMALDLPLIAVSGTMDEVACVDLLHLGAADYLLKDRLGRIGLAVEHALATRDLNRLARTAEQERIQTVNILNSLIENAPAAIEVQDLDGDSMISNAHHRRLSASGPAEVRDCGPDADLAQVVDGQRDVHLDGEVRNFFTARFPVLNAEGTLFAIGSIMVDITAQKRVERQLRDAQIELESRAERLNAVNQELRELDRLKTDFIASVSHELRTPLTSICGYTEVLLDETSGEPDEPPAGMLRVIDRNARRLLNLVEDLLILSRVDTDKQQSSNNPAPELPIVDVACLVQEALLVMRPACEQADVQIQTNLDQAMMVAGNSQQLERVLLNLLSNAVKFSYPGHVVHVAGQVQGDTVVITVTDTGIGVSADEQPKLFTRFFRSASDAAHSIPGTGLGLAVARDIARAHGGDVTMDSEPGRGSTVTVSLPRAYAAASRESSA